MKLINNMKRVIFILATLMISCALPSFGQTSTWQKFSSQVRDFNPVSREVPIKLKSTPVSADACDVTGVFVGSNVFELTGEAWPEGEVVRMKLKGTGVNVMFYGTVSYLDDETVLYEGTFSATSSNGSGVEQPISCMLMDLTAKQEQEAQEKADAEAKWKASPEYKLQTILEGLISSNRAGFVEKQNLTWARL